MSGVELDPDGTDSYHPQHPWEQAGHALYIEPSKRTKSTWPPERTYPAGPHEAVEWARLPKRLADLKGDWYRLYGPEPVEPPHSRACGIKRHEHGPECHSNCPTCGGRTQVVEPVDGEL